MPTSILDILDSAVKIGLGALISGVATYSVTRLRYSQEAKQKISTRKREIIEDAAEAIEKFNEFSHECSHRIFAVVKGIEEPTELHDAAKGLSKGLSYITKSIANIQLLGEEAIVKKLYALKETIVQQYNYVNNCGSKDRSCCDIKKYNDLVDLISNRKEEVLQELSKSYLKDMS